MENWQYLSNITYVHSHVRATHKILYCYTITILFLHHIAQQGENKRDFVSNINFEKLYANSAACTGISRFRSKQPFRFVFEQKNINALGVSRLVGQDKGDVYAIDSGVLFCRVSLV